MGHSHTHSHDHAQCEHGHSHDPLHGHMHVNARDSRALIIAMVSTGVIFVAQVIGGLLSNSLALLSDAGHMLTDLSALLISFAALRIAARPKGTYAAKYTYGLQRVEILAALLNGLLLLAMCAYIVFESIQRFMAPEAVHTIPMLFVAVIGLIANIISAFVLHGSDNLNTRSAYLHVITDLLSSVGVIIGGIIMYFSDIPWIDPLLSLLIALLIVRSGFGVVREASTILLESAPKHIDVEAVRAAMGNVGDVQEVHDVHIWQVGSGEVAISAHIVVDRTDMREEVLHTTRHLLKEQFAIAHSTLQIESPTFAAREKCHGCPL